MTDRSRKRVVVDVDPRGRVSLGRFGFKSTQVVVDQLEGGGLVIHEAVALTPAEAAHYADPAAVKALNEGLRQAQAGDTQPLALRSEKRLISWPVQRAGLLRLVIAINRLRCVSRSG